MNGQNTKSICPRNSSPSQYLPPLEARTGNWPLSSFPLSEQAAPPAPVVERDEIFQPLPGSGQVRGKAVKTKVFMCFPEDQLAI